MTIDPDLLEGDLLASAHDKLQAALQDAGLIGPLVGVDGVAGAPAGPFTNGWIFVGTDNTGTPSRDVTNTGKVSVVLVSHTWWTSNPHNTAEFPILRVLMFGDNTRIAGTTSKAAEDSELKVRKVAKVVRATFHDAANKDHSWPRGLTVVNSTADGGLQLEDVPGSDGVSRGIMLFNLQVST